MKPRPLPTDDESSARFHGWRIVAVCFVMALFGWGFGFYGHAVYLAEMLRVHGWPASIVSGASTAYYLTGALLVAFSADMIARLGPRRFVLGGIVCMAASALAIPWVSAPWQLYAAYLMMAFGWAGLGLGSITNILGLWFARRRGFAISLALNGATCGGIVFAPLLVLLTDRWGFATAMALATAAMVIVLGTLAVTWLRAPAHPHAGQGSTLASAPAIRKSEALRAPAFWSVAGPFALALTAQVGFIVHQIAFLDPLIGRATTGWAVAVTTTMAVIGRVGLGTIIDRLDQRRASALSFASQAAALIAMTRLEGTPALLAACALFGFSVGNLITFPALIIQREFPVAAFGALTALTTAVCQFTYAFGPGLVGLVKDWSGGYGAALALCAALDLAAAAIILVRPRERI